MKAVWAHPEHGAVLAVLTDTGVVTLFSEDAQCGHPRMQPVASFSNQDVTALSFAPKEMGLQLAIVSRRGRVRVYHAASSSAANDWVLQTEFEGSSLSECTSLCWRSYSQALPPMMLLGTREGAQVFYYKGQLMSWELAAKLGNEAVYDVAWASTANGHDEYIASAQGIKVVIWQLKGHADKVQAELVAVLEHTSPVCQVEWNAVGTWLAVATAEGGVNLWRPNLGGEWCCQSKIEPQQQDADYVMVEAK
ncbi:probable Nucleoporin SEH1 [Coccomyxa sp. Obi]|nr:probable Nucleoporin SEH1 [Coccomyxa sp. Obi]